MIAEKRKVGDEVHTEKQVAAAVKVKPMIIGDAKLGAAAAEPN